jgi:hypothetical protein
MARPLRISGGLHVGQATTHQGDSTSKFEVAFSNAFVEFLGFKSNFSIKTPSKKKPREVLRAALFQLVIVGAGGVGEVLYSPRLAHLRF